MEGSTRTTSATLGPAGRAAPNRVADLVRWGPVVAGVVVALGVFALLDALWFALATDGENGWVSGNLDWFVGGTAIGALLVAGFLAGLLSGVRGAGAGLGNGVTAWGLLVVLSLLAGIPGTLGLSAALDLGVTGERALWTLFWSLLIGLGCAALGGLAGGLVRRRVVLPEDREDAPGRSAGDAPREMRVFGNRVVEERETTPMARREEVATASGRRS